MTHDIVTAHREVYRTLLRTTAELGPEQLDWRGLDGKNRITIGSQLLHIAGFDNLVRHAILGDDLEQVATDTWWREQFDAGFPRERDVEPPRGLTINDYHEVLAAESQATQAALVEVAEGRISPEKTVPFMIDGREFDFATVRTVTIGYLAIDAVSHASYHRGQIAQAQFIYSAAQRLL